MGVDTVLRQSGAFTLSLPSEADMSNSFVYNGTRTMYEQAGFEFVRSERMTNTVVRRTIRPA